MQSSSPLQSGVENRKTGGGVRNLVPRGGKTDHRLEGDSANCFFT